MYSLGSTKDRPRTAALIWCFPVGDAGLEPTTSAVSSLPGVVIHVVGVHARRASDGNYAHDVSKHT